MKQQTLNKLKNSNRATQKAVYYDHCDRLMAIALRYCGSVPDAEEVIQDTFVKVFEKINDFDSARGSFEGWTAKIAINFALMALRKKKQMVFYEEDLHAALSVVPNQAIQKIEEEEVEQIIDSLNEKYAVIFKLKAIEGMSHEEIAQLLNIKKEASRTIFSRAKKQLRTIFNEAESEIFNTKKGIL